MKEFIDKLIGRLEEYIKTAKAEGDYTYIKPFEIARSAVNQLAEEYDNGWILCSDRLPEENQMVLTCDKDGWVSTHINMSYKGAKNDFECGYYMAWQPLPEPYQPKGE